MDIKNEMTLFNVGHARDYGVIPAIIIQEIIRRLFTEGEMRDDVLWVRATIADIQSKLDYLTIKQVRFAVDHLVDSCVMIKGNFNKGKFDRSIWYSLHDSIMSAK